MGPVVPAEHIIATPIAVIFFVSFPCVIPLASRLHTRDISLIIRTLRITGSLIAIYFTLVLGAWPFDSMHPRRVLISLKEDVRPFLLCSFEYSPRFRFHREHSA